VRGFGNIDSRMSVLLLEAAWPRLRRKIRRCCLAGGASQASQPSPLAGTLFIWLFFAHLSDAWRRMAHLCDCRWSCGRQGKPSKLSHLPGGYGCLHAHIEQVRKPRQRQCGRADNGCPFLDREPAAQLIHAVLYWRRSRIEKIFHVPGNMIT
jgi:hypothetical protein